MCSNAESLSSILGPHFFSALSLSDNHETDNAEKKEHFLKISQQQLNSTLTRIWGGAPNHDSSEYVSFCHEGSTLQGRNDLNSIDAKKIRKLRRRQAIQRCLHVQEPKRSQKLDVSHAVVEKIEDSSNHLIGIDTILST